MHTADPGAGLACIPSAIPVSERVAHFTLARKLFTTCPTPCHCC
jgi:hypothetical protein